MRYIREAVDCDECFCMFMNIIGALRRVGYSPDDIVQIHYNLVANEIEDLYVLNPNRGSADRLEIEF